MHIEHLSHWSGPLNRECVQSIRTCGYPITQSYLLQVVATMANTMIWHDWCMCIPSRKVERNSLPFQCRWRAGLLLGKMVMTKLEIPYMNDMWLKKLFLLSKQRQAGWRYIDNRMLYGSLPCITFSFNKDVFTKVIALQWYYDARFFVGDYYNDDTISKNSQ